MVLNASASPRAGPSVWAPLLPPDLLPPRPQRRPPESSSPTPARGTLSISKTRPTIPLPSSSMREGMWESVRRRRSVDVCVRRRPVHRFKLLHPSERNRLVYRKRRGSQYVYRVGEYSVPQYQYSWECEWGDYVDEFFND